MKGTNNLLDWEQPFPICLLNMANKIPRGTTIYVSTFPPGFMLQIDLAFSNVESIHEFISIVLAICSSTSLHSGFPYISKSKPIDTLKLLVTTLSNQDKKFELI